MKPAPRPATGRPQPSDAQPSHAQPTGQQPTGAQRELLRAALEPDAAQAVAAFGRWADAVDLDGPVDSETLRLLPLVYARVQAAGATHPTLGRVKGVYRLHWVHAQRHLSAWRPLLAALHDEGLRVIALDGPCVAAGYYDEPSHRPSAGLDLWIGVAAYARARDRLAALGWICLDPPASPRDFAFRHAVAFTRPEQRNERAGDVVLHVHFLPHVGEDEVDAWFAARTQPWRVEGLELEQLEQLAPGALLLRTALAGAAWRPETPLRWLVDATHIARRRRAEIDWDELVAFACRHRLGQRLAAALESLREGDELASLREGDELASLREGALPVVPEAALRRLRAHRAGWLERLEARYLLRAPRFEGSGLRLPVELLGQCIWASARAGGGLGRARVTPLDRARGVFDHARAMFDHARAMLDYGRYRLHAKDLPAVPLALARYLRRHFRRLFLGAAAASPAARARAAAPPARPGGPA